MSELVLIGLEQERAMILDHLQRSGVIEIVESKPERSTLSREDEKREAALAHAESQRERLRRFLKTARQRHPEQNFKGLEATVSEVLDTLKDEASILASVDRFDLLESERKAKLAEADRLKGEQSLLEPWKGLSFDLRDKETKRCAIFAGSLPSEDKRLLLAERLEAELPQTAIEVLREGEAGIQVLLVTLKEQQAKLRLILSGVDFAPLPVEQEASKAAELLEHNRLRLEALSKADAAILEEQAQICAKRAEQMRLVDAYGLKIDRLKAELLLQSSAQAFAFKGWTPSDASLDLKASLEERFVCQVSLRASDKKERFPILLRNNRFNKAFEVIIEMFGAPYSHEVDPSPIMGPFYFIIFGMMLSDVGYGAVLTALCLYLLKKGIQGEGRKMASMLFLSGISSVVWGFVFGSFFGDLIPAVTKGAVTFPTLWFNPLEDPMKMLGFCMFFGLIHLYFGMGIDVYNKIQMGEGMAALLDVVPWYFILTGAGLLFLQNASLVLVSKIFIIGGVAVLVLFGGRDSKNPFLRLAKGVLKLYGITGYLSDVLSYSRILALVLATSVIATVVNQLATMGGSGILGYLLLLVVGTLGHTMNLGLSALSAYVHDSRLQYIEFFGKFYQNGGRFWKPLKDQTEFHRLKREGSRTNRS